MPKTLVNRLIEKFKDRKYFTRKELFEFFRYFEPDLKEGTFGWRIYNLKKKNIIKPIQRGLYVISYKPGYIPNISPNLLKIVKLLTKRFNEIEYCIWETAWLNEFTRHQASKSIFFIEIEKGFEKSLFYELKDIIRRDVFLNHDENVINFYISESDQPVIIKKLVTRAPLLQRTKKKIKFYIPTLEKILVDLFVEKRMFYHLQGSELIHIYENALTCYPVNFTKLLNYAKRRGREKDIRRFMTNHMYHLIKDILDV